jgi:hypothetical protein
MDGIKMSTEVQMRALSMERSTKCWEIWATCLLRWVVTENAAERVKSILCRISAGWKEDAVFR